MHKGAKFIRAKGSTPTFCKVVFRLLKDLCEGLLMVGRHHNNGYTQLTGQSLKGAGLHPVCFDINMKWLHSSVP